LEKNREVNSPGPDRAVVFQNHSLLLPWLTVYENVRPWFFSSTRYSHRTNTRSERDAMTAQSQSRADGPRQDKRPRGNLRRHEAARRHRGALAMEPKAACCWTSPVPVRSTR